MHVGGGGGHQGTAACLLCNRRSGVVHAGTDVARPAMNMSTAERLRHTTEARVSVVGNIVPSMAQCSLPMDWDIHSGQEGNCPPSVTSTAAVQL